MMNEMKIPKQIIKIANGMTQNRMIKRHLVINKQESDNFHKNYFVFNLT